MKIYATVDQSGFPSGYYSEDVHKIIPSGAIEITETQYAELLNNSGRRKVQVISGVASIVEYAPSPPTPEQIRAAMPTISAWQVRKALNAAGLRATVEAAVAASDEETKDAWEYATEYKRTDPVLLRAAAVIGLTDQQLDDLFALARTL